MRWYSSDYYPPTNVTATTLDNVAAPKLPVFIQNFVLPAGSQVMGLQVIQILNEAVLKGQPLYFANKNGTKIGLKPKLISAGI